MTIDVEKLIKSLGYIHPEGLNATNRTEFLAGITEALSLQESREWILHCAKRDARHCKEYLTIPKDILLTIDGRTLKEYPEKEITLDLVRTAINANVPLTMSMIGNTAKIKNVINNEFILEQANSSGYSSLLNATTETYNHDVLCLWKRKGKSFCELAGITYTWDLYVKLNVTRYLCNPEFFPANKKRMLSNLNLPETFWKVWDEVDSKVNIYRNLFSKRKLSGYLPMSDDPEEDSLFMGNLRVKGLYSKLFESDGRWKGLSEYVKALLINLCESYPTL